MPPRSRHMANEDDALADFMANVHRTGDSREVSLSIAQAQAQAKQKAMRLSKAVKKKIEAVKNDTVPYEEAPYLASRHPNRYERALSRAATPFAGFGPSGRERHAAPPPAFVQPLDNDFADLVEEPKQKKPRRFHVRSRAAKQKPQPQSQQHAQASHAMPNYGQADQQYDPQSPTQALANSRLLNPAKPIPREQLRGYKPPEKRRALFSQPADITGAAGHGNGAGVSIKVAMPAVSKKIVITFAVIAVMAGAAFGAVKIGPTALATVRNIGAPPSPLPSEAKAKVKAPVYIPRRLPEGYFLSTESVSQPSEDVVIYTIENDEGRKIYVSQQQQQPDFKYDDFHNALKNKEEFPIALGKLIIGDAGNGQTVGSLLTGKTWIMMNTNVGVSYPEMLEIFKNLREG